MSKPETFDWMRANGRPVCLCWLLLVTGPALAAVPDSVSPPNVILVMSDDQGWGDTGYNGHPHLKTPHLDRLAADGLVFVAGTRRRRFAAPPAGVA